MEFIVSCRKMLDSGRLWVTSMLAALGLLQAQGATTPLENLAVPASPIPTQSTNIGSTNAPQLPPHVLSLTEIAQATQTTQTTLDKLEDKYSGNQAVVQSLQTKEDAWKKKIPKALKDSREMIVQTGSLASLEELRNLWSVDDNDLKAAILSLTDFTEILQVDLDKLNELKSLWQRSLEALPAEATAGTINQVQRMLQRIESLLSQLKSRQTQAINLQTALGDLEGTVAEILKEISRSLSNLEGSLLLLDAPPLWTALEEEDFQLNLDAMNREWRMRMESLKLYASKNQINFFVQILLLILSLMTVFLLRKSKVSTDLGEKEARARRLLQERPIAVAVVSALSFSPLIHPESVIGYRMLLAPVVIILLLRLIWVLLDKPGRQGILFTSFFFLADYLRSLLWSEPTLERLFLLAESIGATICLFFFPLSLVKPGLQRFMWRWTRIILLAQLSLATFCLIFGAIVLGRLLTYAAIFFPYMAYCSLTIFLVLSSTATVLLRSPLALRLGLLRKNQKLVEHYLTRGLGLFAFLIFIYQVLDAYSIRNHVINALTLVFSSPLTLGKFSISLGDILSFVFVIWFSFKLSQIIRAIFHEDIFPRMRLPLGVPYAASAAMHYAILMVGFFIAIMAAGVDMNRFAILGGAVGVGVGFGLQNIVNNFVSGLILLFERPIKIGDRIELETILGDVQRIGIRSSTVRTYDGAEVIVPNSDLIANKLTNWTLSDHRRRIIVPIGVKYGTDPNLILQLLVQVAKGNPDLLEYPKPEAFFRAHGESSLDFELRAWTDRSSEWMHIQSNLTVAINRILTENNIEIPFPQRDLHFRSSDVPFPTPPPNLPEAPPQST